MTKVVMFKLQDEKVLSCVNYVEYWFSCFLLTVIFSIQQPLIPMKLYANFRYSTGLNFFSHKHISN